jgi:hypothetical protein
MTQDEFDAQEEVAKDGRSFGIRDLLGAVNLRDFAHMVRAEGVQIATSVRLAFEALTSRPLGVILFFAGMLMAAVRSCLLVFVVIFFGGAILAITLIRGIARLLGSRRAAKKGDLPPDDL